MSIWDAFGKGRYKGFSREAGQLLDKAVELAGGLGCKKADTGHLLWAMLQADGGPAARFLAGKNISEREVRRQLSAGRDGSVTRLARGDMAADLRRAMDYAIIGAQNAHLSRAEPEHLLCAMLEDTDCAAGVMLASMGVQLTEAVRQPGQRQILPRFDPPGGGRRAGPGVLPGKRAGPDGRDLMPPPEEQPLPCGRTGRGQDRAGRRACPAHRRQAGTPDAPGAASAGAGHGQPRGWYEVPRRLRRAVQEPAGRTRPGRQRHPLRG